MLDSIERAMDEVGWPESDEETAIDDFVVHVEAMLKARRPARVENRTPKKEKKENIKPLTAEQLERRELRKAQKLYDKKAADMELMAAKDTATDTIGDDHDWVCEKDHIEDKAQWLHVLSVIDVLHARYEEKEQLAT